MIRVGHKICSADLRRRLRLAELMCQASCTTLTANAWSSPIQFRKPNNPKPKTTIVVKMLTDVSVKCQCKQEQSRVAKKSITIVSTEFNQSIVKMCLVTAKYATVQTNKVFNFARFSQQSYYKMPLSVCMCVYNTYMNYKKITVFRIPKYFSLDVCLNNVGYKIIPTFRIARIMNNMLK